MDFFAGLSGMRFPDARINGGGPLPTDLSGPAGINGDADGLYNASSELLSGITPYAGPKAGRMGSDRNYQQIPHRVQYAVPKLFLPSMDGTGDLELSHAVDNGDLAFVVRKGQRLLGRFWNPNDPMRKATPVLCNVVTVNYLLAGLQKHLLDRIEAIGSGRALTDTNNLWWKLLMDWGLEKEVTELEVALRSTVQGYRGQPVVAFEIEKAKRLVRSTYFTSKLLRDTFVPFGVCAGSEKQGGLNETGLAPVQATCAHMTTLTVDGQNLDMVNIWRHMSVSSGDILCLSLKHMEVRSFTLNHYYKAVQRVEFPAAFKCAQIVPSVRGIDMLMELVEDPEDHINMPLGYWKVAQSMVHAANRMTRFENNDTKFLDGALMQVLFAPAWNRLQDTPRDFQMKGIMLPSSQAAVCNDLMKNRTTKHLSWIDVNKPDNKLQALFPDLKPGQKHGWHIIKYKWDGSASMEQYKSGGTIHYPGGKYTLIVDLMFWSRNILMANVNCSFFESGSTIAAGDREVVIAVHTEDTEVSEMKSWQEIQQESMKLCETLHQTMAEAAISENILDKSRSIKYRLFPTSGIFDNSNMGSPAWYYRGGQLHRCDAMASGASGTADTAGTGPTDAEMVDAGLARSEPADCLTLRQAGMPAAPAPAPRAGGTAGAATALDGEPKRRPDDPTEDPRPSMKKVKVVKKPVAPE
jgi:hypothetical protein